MKGKRETHFLMLPFGLLIFFNQGCIYYISKKLKEWKVWISKEEVTSCKSETFKAILWELWSTTESVSYCYKRNLKLFKIEWRKEMKGNLTQIVNTHKKTTCEYKGMRNLKDHRKGH